jgi:TRAP-type transport system small permease protein
VSSERDRRVAPGPTARDENLAAIGTDAWEQTAIEETAPDAGPDRIEVQRALLPGAWRAVDRGVLRATRAALAVIGGVFTVMVTAEVVSRYVFSFSIFFVNAGARLLLVWFFLLGAGIALRQGAHVGFELLVSRTHGAARRRMLTLAYVCSLVFFVEMVWGGVYSIAPAIPQNEAGLGISVVWFVLSVPVGFLLLSYHALVLLVVLWRQPLDPAPAP